MLFIYGAVHGDSKSTLSTFCPEKHKTLYFSIPLTPSSQEELAFSHAAELEVSVPEMMQPWLHWDGFNLAAAQQDRRDGGQNDW